MAMMTRNGKPLAIQTSGQDGHPRRLPDMRNAWKKASNAQRLTILTEIILVDDVTIATMRDLCERRIVTLPLS
jgi:hypothetical protein